MDVARRRSGGLVRVASLAIAFCAYFSSARAAAAELGSEEGPLSVELHGFASQGFILTLNNDYLADKTTRGSFKFSEVGINFTKQLNETLRFGVQLFAQDLGPTGDYKAKVDWFYLDYRWRDWLGIRAGRMKIPYGLHNEIQDVDAARVPVLLPPSVYPLQSRQILFAQTGAELYGFVRSPAAGALEYRLFGGTIFLDSDSLTPPGSPFDLEFRVPYVVGGRVIWETPITRLRFAGSVEQVRLDTTVFIPGMASLSITSKSLLWVASAEYALHDLVLTSEYSRWRAKQWSSEPMLSPPIDVESERAYVMATYRSTPWLQTGAYYALLFPDTAHREGRENKQHDVALTLRFDINDYWLFKLEGHYLIGTAGLSNPLRINPPDISKADAYWAAFFLKTTAHF